MPQRRQHVGRKGFTLLEALMATGILLVAVLAVTTAVTASQQNALEAQQRVAAALAAEDLMGRLYTEPYDDLAAWDGFVEPVGALLDLKGLPAPDSLGMIGRRVSVTEEMHTLTSVSLRVRGSMVCVETFDADDRVLTELCTFVPEPQS